MPQKPPAPLLATLSGLFDLAAGGRVAGQLRAATHQDAVIDDIARQAADLEGEEWEELSKKTRAAWKTRVRNILNLLAHGMDPLRKVGAASRNLPPR
jgi:hypothetical protein